MIRTTLPAERLGAPAAVRAYKQLKLAEHAFRTMKDTIEIRPIHHHLADRVRAHVFLCMLAYYIAYELEQRLTPLLFTDETPLAPIDPVKPAIRSPSARAKAGSARTAEGFPAHTLPDLLADLATICRNHISTGASDHTFARVTTPTPLQAQRPRPCSIRQPGHHAAKAEPSPSTPIPRHHGGIQHFNRENFRLKFRRG